MDSFSYDTEIPEELLDMITSKFKDRISHGFIPHILILWRGYMNYIYNALDYHDLTILGLRVIWTDIPDTVEVY